MNAGKACPANLGMINKLGKAESVCCGGEIG